MAVLNANYVRAQLGGTYRIPYDELCKHEVVVQPPQGKRALDIAKGLIDYGYHPPTIYFPLVVKEAMLIEPTETESKETLDDFIGDRKSTRLNSSHANISYAVFCLKKKKYNNL